MKSRSAKERVWHNLLVKAVPPIIGALVTILVLLRRLIFTPGYVIYRDLFPGQLHYPYLWHPQGSFLALENYKFVTFTGIFLPLQAFGLDVYEKVVYTSAVAIAYLALYIAVFRLLGRVRGTSFSLRTRHLASSLSALTYVANPAAANIFFDFSLFVGYAFCPLILVLFMEMLAGQRRRGPTIVAIALLWWMSAIKAHWIVFGALALVLPLVVWCLSRLRRRDWSGLGRNLLASAAIVMAYLLLSAYWLIPFGLSSRERFVGSYAPMTFESVAYLSHTPLNETLRLLGSFQAWPYVRFEPPTHLLTLPWSLASWVIPALAIAAVVWFRKHWQVWVLIACAAGGILLAKGVAPPLSGIYKFLVFGDLTPPAFRWLFRVASKWNVFLSLGYSGLAAFALAKLAARIRWDALWRGEWLDRRSAVAALVLVGYLTAFLLFAWPSFTGDFNGALVPVPLPDSLRAANQWLETQPGDFKVNWMPVTNGREMFWNRRPSGDLFTSLSSRPSIATNWNRHPVLYYSYAYDALAGDRLTDFGKLLSVLNTRYVAYHDDIVTSHVHEGVEPVAVLIESGEADLTAQLEAQDDVSLSWQDGFVSVYQVAETAGQLFVPQRVFLVTDDLTLLTSLTALDGFHPVKDALVFDMSARTSRFLTEANGLLLGPDATDHLAFSLLPGDRLLSPAAATNHGEVTRAWSRFDVYQFDWQSVLRSRGIHAWSFDYGKGMVAHAEPSGASLAAQQGEAVTFPTLQLPVDIEKKGAYRVWVNHLHHPGAAALLVSLDGETQSVVPGDDPVTGFFWDDTGTIELEAGEHVVGLENRDGFTAVNAIAIVSEDEMTRLRSRSQELAAEIPNIYLLEAEHDFDTGRAESPKTTATFSAGNAVSLTASSGISTTVDLVTPGGYTLALRGSSTSISRAITVTLGTTQIHLEPQGDDPDPTWFTGNTVWLGAGPTPIHVQAAAHMVVDACLLYTNDTATTPEDLFPEVEPPAEIDYEKVDPTRYRVRVRAERPFMLALAETYDPLWVASGPDLQVSSTPLYGVINGFMLDQTGSYELTIEYQAQQWARFGKLLTSAAAVVAGLFVMLAYLRQRPPAG